MTSIFSKRHFYKFYLSSIICAVFFLALAMTMFITYHNISVNEEPPIKYFLFPLLGCGMIALSFYTIYKYIKNAPHIILDEDFIHYGSDIYSYESISRIQLTGKHDFKFVLDLPMEATAITFDDHKTILVFDDMYSNSWEIKCFLKQVVLEKKAYTEPQGAVLPRDTGENIAFDNFKGNPHTSLRGLSVWIFTLFVGYILLNNSKPIVPETALFLSGFSCIWILLNGWMMHYFQVSKEYFIVRNHLFFWKRKVYDITLVKEIVFETEGKLPICLRIITTDFRTKLYPAGTLRDKDWLRLKDKVRGHKLKVRNECV